MYQPIPSATTTTSATTTMASGAEMLCFIYFPSLTRQAIKKKDQTFSLRLEVVIRAELPGMASPLVRPTVAISNNREAVGIVVGERIGHGIRGVSGIGRVR